MSFSDVGVSLGALTIAVILISLRSPVTENFVTLINEAFDAGNESCCDFLS